MLLTGLALLIAGWMPDFVHAQTDEFFSGYIPTPQSELDQISPAPRYRSFLPASIDLSGSFPTPRDQGRINSCVGWSVGYAARSYHAVLSEGRPRDHTSHIPSPNYIYNRIRDPKDCQSGSKFPDAFRLLMQGSLSFAERPSINGCELPSQSDIGRADDFRILGWQRVDHRQIDDIKGQLARGNPVIVGIQVDRGFHDLRGNRVYAQTRDQFTNHAVVAVGYDDRRQAIKVINSWGRRWGDDGFGWVAYGEFTRNVRETYVISVRNIIPRPVPRPIIVEPEETEKTDVAVLPSPSVAPTDLPQPNVDKPALTVEDSEQDEVPPRKIEPETDTVTPEDKAPPVPTVRPDPPPVSDSETADTDEVPIPTEKPRPLPQQPTPPPPQVVDVTEVPIEVNEPISDDDCSRLTSRRTGPRTVIGGFVGTQSALDRVRARFPEEHHDLDVELRPWPQCEVLMTLGDRLDGPNAPELSIRGGDTTLRAGDALTIEVTTPRKPVFVYISYVQADGSVVHLRQPPGVVPTPDRSATRFIFGDGREGRARFTVSEPFGREMIVVLASASPLFEAALPDVQIERDYLSALRRALLFKADPKMPDRQVSVAFLGLQTRED